MKSFKLNNVDNTIKYTFIPKEFGVTIELDVVFEDGKTSHDYNGHYLSEARDIYRELLKKGYKSP